MALESKIETLYYIECDGCRQRAPFAFHKITAFCKARRVGFRRHDTTDKDRIWLCRVCQRELAATSPEKAPLNVVPARS